MKLLELIRPYRSNDDHNLKDLKELKGKARLIQIWDYYKVPIFLILLVIYIVGYGWYRHVTVKTPLLYMGLVNVSVGEDLHRTLCEDFVATTEYPEKKYSVQTYDNLILTEYISDKDQAYVHASQMKILASIDGEMLDIVLMNKEAFDAFSQNGYLVNMEEFLQEQDPSLSETLTPFLEENIEILSDNSSEVMADRSIPYVSETTSYKMGIDLSGCRAFSEAGFTEPVYMGVLRNTPRQDMIFLHYLYNSQEAPILLYRCFCFSLFFLSHFCYSFSGITSINTNERTEQGICYAGKSRNTTDTCGRKYNL